MVSHGALLVAVHAHDAPAVTATVVVSPAAGEVLLVGAMEYVHGVPGCVTVNVWPAMVTVPERWLVPPFAATTIETLPLPVPAALPEIVSQPALLNAVHPHDAPAVTATVVVSPAAGEVLLVGAIV
jgi:hypothetical protein